MIEENDVSLSNDVDIEMAEGNFNVLIVIYRILLYSAFRGYKNKKYII